MSNRRSRNGKTRSPRSLTATGWLKPTRWQISRQEAADALLMPLERIVKVYPKRHQVIVVFLNEQGQKCSSFFSYRLFARWQTEAIAAILSCNLEVLASLEEVVQYDIQRFNYLPEMADAIWDALLDHITRLAVAERFAKEAVK
ncbi:hypothetical protein H6F74_21670 [Trichocoleus sp. FACHB-90]|uniref:hypothetical protein n=1 Tax=Cyanophyceae TaxID=3028117 RepID=UPI0016846A73|nr:hypothetical protein [Trichocoleus sp. FACHB-90]MBD1928833.1 hypothetical protein [Trichocoleus sp. FACHB-90]